MYGRPLRDAALIACPQCDLLQRLPAIAPRSSARCPRCDFELWRRREDSLDRTLALAIAAAILYVVANSDADARALGRRPPGFDHGPRRRRAALEGRTRGRGRARPLHRRRSRRRCRSASRWRSCSARAAIGRRAGWDPAPPSRGHATWSMIEVMMLGVLVALIKIAELRDRDPGDRALRAGRDDLLLAALQASFDPREIWERVTWARSRTPATRGERGMSAPTALRLGLVRCEGCGCSRARPPASTTSAARGAPTSLRFGSRRVCSAPGRS